MTFEQVKKVVSDFKQMKEDLDEFEDSAEFDAPYQEPSKTAQVIVKEYHQTKKLDGDVKTELNCKEVQMEVKQFRIQKGNIIKGDRAFF